MERGLRLHPSRLALLAPQDEVFLIPRTEEGAISARLEVRGVPSKSLYDEVLACVALKFDAHPVFRRHAELAWFRRAGFRKNFKAH